MTKYRQLLRGFLVIVIGLLLGAIILLFFDRNLVPAKAQAQELFTLHFELDHVRQESAQILTELMILAKDPGRAGTEATVGSKPSLSSQEELTARLQENRILVEQTLTTIDADRFSDPQVDLRYDAVRTFYTSLIEFEDMVLKELSLSENNAERYAHLATVLYEGTAWPALLAEDAHLRDMLTSLAELHNLEFNPIPYEDLSRERLIELDTPIISDDVNTIEYPFTVNGTATYYVLLNVSFDIPLSDKIEISLEDPQGRIISSDQLVEYTDSDNSAELNHLSYISRSESVIIVKLFPEDPVMMPIPGAWKLYITAPIGCNMVIGMVEL
jgi:hypothetical protein